MDKVQIVIKAGEEPGELTVTVENEEAGGYGESFEWSISQKLRTAL